MNNYGVPLRASIHVVYVSSVLTACLWDEVECLRFDGAASRLSPEHNLENTFPGHGCVAPPVG